MTDEQLTALAQFGVILVGLHAIAVASDAAREVSDELWRRELIGLDDLPDA